MHHPALAQPAFARDGIESEAPRTIAGNDGERGLDHGLAGAFGARGLSIRDAGTTLREANV